MALPTVEQVFTPGTYPAYTYVVREDQKHEIRLRDALRTPGMIASVSGSSKSGKTVLVERVVGKSYLVDITGAGIEKAEDVWDRVLDKLGSPHEEARAHEVGGELAAGIEMQGQGMLFPGWSFGAKTTTQAKFLGKKSLSVKIARRGLYEVIERLSVAKAVVLIDDFHFMPTGVQLEVAKQMKEMAKQGVKLCVALVPHRSDDIVRVLGELRGRVQAIELPKWTNAELEQIALLGFKDALEMECGVLLPEQLASESLTSRQLMPALCLQACRTLGIRDKSDFRTRADLDQQQRLNVLRATSALCNMKSECQVLFAGPELKRPSRQTYRFRDGSVGDVYYYVLRAFALSARLQKTVDELSKCAGELVEGESPSKQSLAQTCKSMSTEARKRFPDSVFIDWSSSTRTLHIVDPYLLFFVRWSEFLRTAHA